MARSFTYGTAFQQMDFTTKFFDEASVLPQIEAAASSVIGSGYFFRGPVADENGNFVYKNLTSTIEGFRISSWAKLDGLLVDTDYSGLSVKGNSSSVRTEPSGCQPCELDFFSPTYCFNSFSDSSLGYSEVIASGEVASGDSVTVHFLYELGDIKDQDGVNLVNYKGRTVTYTQRMEVYVPFSFITRRYYRPVYCGKGCDCTGSVGPVTEIDAFWKDWTVAPSSMEWDPYDALVSNVNNIEYANDGRNRLGFFYEMSAGGQGGCMDIENCTSLSDLYCPSLRLDSVKSLNNSNIKYLWIDSITGANYASDLLDLASGFVNSALSNDYMGGIFGVDCRGLSGADLLALEGYMEQLNLRQYFIVTGHSIFG